MTRNLIMESGEKGFTATFFWCISPVFNWVFSNRMVIGIQTGCSAPALRVGGDSNRFKNVDLNETYRKDKENLECQKYVKFVVRNRWSDIMSAMRII